MPSLISIARKKTAKNYTLHFHFHALQIRKTNIHLRLIGTFCLYHVLNKNLYRTNIFTTIAAIKVKINDIITMIVAIHLFLSNIFLNCLIGPTKKRVLKINISCMIKQLRDCVQTGCTEKKYQLYLFTVEFIHRNTLTFALRIPFICKSYDVRL